MPINIYLQEAAEPSGVKPNEIISGIKKQLNVCRLAKFRSEGENGKFYSAFFLSTLDLEVQPSMEDWGLIYNTLLCDNVFVDNLCLFVTMYRPFSYANIFHPLYNLVINGLETAGKRKIAYLGNAKAIFSMLQMKFQMISNIIIGQIRDPETMKFLTVIDQTLQQFIFQLYHMTQETLEKEADPDDIKPIIGTSIVDAPLTENVQEFIDLLEHADEWISNYMANDNTQYLDEGVVKNAVMKAKEAKLKAEKATKAFEEFVMKKFREMTIKRRNAKHSEMVGESLRIVREIKRLLKSGAIGILSPTLGVIHWIVTLFIDKKTDKEDRKVLIGEIKDELEIIEEKITMAERNGDDKAKIELIRYRQKLQKEYERILHVKYDKERLRGGSYSNM